MSRLKLLIKREGRDGSEEIEAVNKEEEVGMVTRRLKLLIKRKRLGW